MSLRSQIARHQDGVYSLCLRWIGDPDRAVSAARGALVAWAQSRANRPDPTVALYREAVARCERAGARPDPDMPPLDRRLHRVLDRMDESERPVLLLRDVADLDVDQIARVLDLSRGSVVSRLQRARMKLARAQIQDEPQVTLEIADEDDSFEGEE